MLKRRDYYSTVFLYFLKIAIALTGAVIFPIWLGDGKLSIPVILGAVAAGLTDIDDSLKGRLTNTVIILVLFFIAALGVDALLPYPILFLIAIMASSAFLIFLGSLGSRFATITFGTLVIVVYAMLTYKAERPWFLLPSLLVSGAFWYSVVAFLFNIALPSRPMQEALGKCYQELAQFLEAKSLFFDPDDDSDLTECKLRLTQISQTLGSTLETTRISIMRRLKHERGRRSARAILNYYLAAQEIFERAGSSHVDYQELKKEFPHSDLLFRFQRLMSAQGFACQKIASELLYKERYHHDGHFKMMFTRLKESLGYLTQEYQQESQQRLLYSTGSLLKNLSGIDEILLSLDREKELLLTAKESAVLLAEPKTDSSPMLESWRKVSRHFTPESPIFRHAMRVSLLMGIGFILAEGMNLIYSVMEGETVRLTTPYWIMLTSVFVCQPNYSATKTRTIKRLSGTVLGVVVTMFLLKLGLSREGQALFVVISGTLFFVMRQARYAYATALITMMVLFCFNLIDAGFVAPERLLDTFVGSLLAWAAVTYIYPEWRYRQLSVKIDAVKMANVAYLHEIAQQYHHGRVESPLYIKVRDDAGGRAGELVSLFSTLTVEPKTTRETLDYLFKVLALNNTFLSYVSALGAHRAALGDAVVLEILDEAVSRIEYYLTGDEPLDLNEHQRFLVRIEEEREKLSVDEQRLEEISLHQVQLLLRLLPDYVEAIQTPK